MIDELEEKDYARVIDRYMSAVSAQSRTVLEQRKELDELKKSRFIRFYIRIRSLLWTR